MERAGGPVEAIFVDPKDPRIALAVYGGLLMLFRVVTAEDAAAVSSWVRQAICGWSHG